MLDYVTLKLIWWLLIGVLLIGFAIMDGHDMGIGTLLLVIGKDDTDRRVMLNTIAPHWDGNQVWFITAGGAIFAAWPFVYATAFSGMYWALLLVLFALFFRPVGFEYRSKLTNPTWRKGWDCGLFIGSAVPALVFGVAFGNLFLGVPFRLDETMRSFYSGSFWALLNPFALLFGVISVSLFTLQGATYLAHRTDGPLQLRAQNAVKVVAIILLACFSLAGFLVSRIDGYVIQSIGNVEMPLTPLMKDVGRVSGAWFGNYTRYPILWLIPALAYLGGIGAMLTVRSGRGILAFVCSSFTCVSVILTAGVALFPFILPSSEMPQASLTVWDATSSHLTLNVMLYAALIFTPIVVVYTSWAYHVMAGKVTRDFILKNDKSVY